MEEESQTGAGRKRHPTKHEAIVTPGALVIPLDEHHQRGAEECLKRSGTIRFELNEISVTSLTGIVELEHEVIID